MSRATMTTKGRVTIPKYVRDLLSLRAGDRIDFIVTGAAEAVIRRVPGSAAEVTGMLARAQEPVSVGQMDEAVHGRFSRGQH